MGKHANLCSEPLLTGDPARSFSFFLFFFFLLLLFSEGQPVQVHFPRFVLSQDNRDRGTPIAPGPCCNRGVIFVLLQCAQLITTPDDSGNSLSSTFWNQRTRLATNMTQHLDYAHNARICLKYVELKSKRLFSCPNGQSPSVQHNLTMVGENGVLQPSLHHPVSLRKECPPIRWKCCEFAASTMPLAYTKKIQKVSPLPL